MPSQLWMHVRDVGVLCEIDGAREPAQALCARIAEAAARRLPWPVRVGKASASGVTLHVRLNRTAAGFAGTIQAVRPPFIGETEERSPAIAITLSNGQSDAVLDAAIDRIGPPRR